MTVEDRARELQATLAFARSTVQVPPLSPRLVSLLDQKRTWAKKAAAACGIDQETFELAGLVLGCALSQVAGNLGAKDETQGLFAVLGWSLAVGAEAEPRE